VTQPDHPIEPAVLAVLDQNRAAVNDLVRQVRQHRLVCDAYACPGTEVLLRLLGTDPRALLMYLALAVYELSTHDEGDRPHE